MLYSCTHMATVGFKGLTGALAGATEVRLFRRGTTGREETGETL